jgi:glucose-6-phosphate isomerase
MFAGEKINVTERRAAQHMAQRVPRSSTNALICRYRALRG